MAQGGDSEGARSQEDIITSRGGQGWGSPETPKQGPHPLSEENWADRLDRVSRGVPSGVVGRSPRESGVG